MDRDIRSLVFSRVLSVVSFSIQAETRRFELAVPQRVVRTKGLGLTGPLRGTSQTFPVGAPWQVHTSDCD